MRWSIRTDLKRTGQAGDNKHLPLSQTDLDLTPVLPLTSNFEQVTQQSFSLFIWNIGTIEERAS